MLELLKDVRAELWLCRTKDGAGPYDATVKPRLDIAISKLEQQERCDDHCYSLQTIRKPVPAGTIPL